MISTAQLTRIFRRQARESGAVEDLRDGEILLKILGLVEPDDDLSGYVDAVASDVAGAYDTKTEKLYVIRDAIPDDQAVVEVTIAHELTHALEDQVFELKEADALSGDRALAYSALTEGSATAVMIQFAAERNLLGQLLLSDPGTSDIEDVPPVLQAQLVFPYLAGQEFVQALRRAGGDWDLVGVAEREDPPASTEQVLHPQRYLEGDDPVQVSVDPAPILGGGWRFLDGADVGEFDLRQIITVGAGLDETDGLGWGGGRYSLWARRGAAEDCVNTCRAEHALVLALRFDNRGEASAFSGIANAYLDELGGKPQINPGGGSAEIPEGAAAYGVRGDEVTLAFAPTLPLARRLAADS